MMEVSDIVLRSNACTERRRSVNWIVNNPSDLGYFTRRTGIDTRLVGILSAWVDRTG